MRDIQAAPFWPMEINDINGYFTLYKLNPDTIPEGFHCYELSELVTVDSKPLTHDPFIGAFVTMEDISGDALEGAIGNITSLTRYSFNELLDILDVEKLSTTGNMLC